MGAIGLPRIVVTPLARIATAGGDVLHALKNTDDGYSNFGEAYFSWVTLDSIKAWKRHLRMTMNLVVPAGRVKFVFYAEVDGGKQLLNEETIGVEHYARITVPPGVWFGFKGLSSPQSLVLNLASIPHDPSEVERLPLGALPYDWK
jgi:dTDP-4-dehydrorhamnose 3,5-epimerase